MFKDLQPIHLVLIALAVYLLFFRNGKEGYHGWNYGGPYGWGHRRWQYGTYPYYYYIPRHQRKRRSYWRRWWW